MLPAPVLIVTRESITTPLVIAGSAEPMVSVVAVAPPCAVRLPPLVVSVRVLPDEALSNTAPVPVASRFELRSMLSAAVVLLMVCEPLLLTT